MMKFFLVLLTALFFLWVSSHSAFAQGSGPAQGAGIGAGTIITTFLNTSFGTCSTEEISGIFCVVGKVINLLIGIAGGVSILFMVYGGIMYMASGGDMKQLESAKATVTYSLFGLIIIIGAILVVNTILAGLIG